MTDDVRVLPTQEGYDLWAETYDTMGNWLLAMEEPALVRVLGDIRGLAVLDVGTGTGRHAIRLAEAGAHVTAVDFSEEMIARARAKAGAERIRFLVHDVRRPFPFSERSFDVVLSALVLEHIPVAELRPFFAELGRLVRPEGRIVVTAMHPAMFQRGRSAAFRDEAGREVRPRSYVATLSDYTESAERSGLAIVKLSEYTVDEAFAARHERARKALGWPALVVMVLVPKR